MKTILAPLVGSSPVDLRRTCRLLLAATCVMTASSAWADTKLVTDGSSLRYLVPTDGSLGGTWRGLSFNDSTWHPGQNGVGYEVTPGAYNASVIADSRGEWSATGRQGENHWINGYYDKTGDADGIYQRSDFQPFPRSDGPWAADNFWSGSAWDWFNGDPPWDTIGSTDVHPNGVNNAVEHWVIRRWSSTAAGAITLRFQVRKSNPSGAGVTGKIFRNGAEIFTRAIAGGDSTGFEVYVNTTAALGDVFDFALTPVGPGGDDGDGADGSILSATVLSGTVMPPPGPVVPVGIADSASDWSSAGVQGANGWFYGYYNRTADADGTYNPNTDFNTTDPNWNFAGAWQLGVTGDPGANPPWDTIGQTDWHPNGDNQPQGIHWVIRRWVCEVDGDIYARVRFAKANINGNGTTLHVFRNGVEAYTTTLNNTLGVDTFVPFPGSFIGDKIDFALDPKGTDGLFNDGSDSSTFTATIFTGTPPPMATTVADSVADWSAAGVQGANGWTYGFYNETADADHAYNPNTDFNTTDPNWTFSGAWTLGPGDPPWDTIEQINWHPNGDNQPQGIHWVIRRWVSDVDGDLHAHVQFGKQNVGGGNGTTLRILHNGTQVFSRTVAFSDGTGIDTNVNLPGVFVGDKIEFALDPLGTDGSKGDGADGSFLRASLLTGLIAPPPPPFVPGIADCFRTDLETAMKGVNPSVFIRIPFNVANPAAIETLKLKIKYNDGFAAYLNGTEIVKRNAPTSIAGITVADSIADWSTNPDVTVNGWSYGYYDQSLDADGTYSGGSDFRAFPHDGGGYSPTDFWNGSGWDWFNGNPPWTELFQEATHPNNPNGGAVDPGNPATHLHSTIRRWNATVDANLKCRVRFRKLNTGCGDGVRVSVFHNSGQVYSQTIAGNDGVGRDDTIDLPDVFLGDTIDIILGSGDANDFCDGSAFSAVLFEGEPSIPWDGAATASRTTTETISPEVFDITGLISSLQPGANVLAIQGFNAGVNDNEFVINAELLANQVPTAANDAVVATTDVPATYPASVLLANDSDPDGDRLLLVGVTPSYTTAQGGTVRLYGDTVRYAPPAGYSGPDSFNYTINDGGSQTASALVQVNVVGNRAPVATDDSRSTAEDTAVTLNVVANDSDVDGDALTVIATTSPAHGAAVNNGNGTITYTPNANYNGPDSFTYTISDGKGGTDVGAVQITVTPINDPPTANAQSVATAEDTSKVITLTGSDPEGDVLTFAIHSPPAHGTLAGAPPNVTYTPAANYCGPDSFTFTANDSEGVSTAAVTIAVTCLNDPPVARDDTASTAEGTPVTINVLANDSDPDGDTLMISASSLPGNGSITINGGNVIYTPNAGFTGGDGFTYHIVDGHGGVASANVSILVRSANSCPVSHPSVTHPCSVPGLNGLTILSADNENGCVILDGTLSTDADGDTLTYAWYLDGALVPFAMGAVVSNCFDLGAHTITLAVDDGRCVGTDSIRFDIVTACEAVEALIHDINSANLVRKNKRPLLASLKAACASFDRGNSSSSINQLQAFQNKVRAQISRNNPVEAARFIAATQVIIDAVNCAQALDAVLNPDEDGEGGGSGHRN